MIVDGGDETKPLVHSGVKGMRWGIRKTPAQRAKSAKEKRKKQETKQKLKIAGKMNAGEVVASAMIGGPIGVIGYSAIKHHAAKVKKENSNLSDQQQTAAAGRLKLGEALAVTVVSSPVGLITYAAAKQAAAHQVDSF